MLMKAIKEETKRSTVTKNKESKQNQSNIANHNKKIANINTNHV